MTDAELLEEFTDVQKRPDGIAIRVCKITWASPSEPKTEWLTAAILPANATKADVVKARQDSLENKTYFAVCTECRARKPIGWMEDDNICQSCAQQNHGVVY